MCRFYNNVGHEGGAIACGGQLKVADSVFQGNHSPSRSMGNSGGGAIAGMFCAAEIENSTFSYNTADMYGGALDNYASTATIVNSTFYGNHAGYAGGAIDNPKGEQEGSGVVTLVHTTIVGNSAGVSGSALHSTGAVTITNSIMSDNVGEQSCVNDGGTLSDGGGNLRWPKKDATCPGTVGNPMLAPLGGYGGFTDTLALLPGSMAINAGTNEGCTETDQRGVERHQLEECDAGAFESRGFILAVQNGDYQGVKIGNRFPRPLEFLVLSRYSEPVNGGQARFVGPESGASLDPGVTVATIEDGAAKIKAKANSIPGFYSVKGRARGGTNAAEFHLGNIE